jgi:hypothetical protein
LHLVAVVSQPIFFGRKKFKSALYDLLSAGECTEKPPR